MKRLFVFLMGLMLFISNPALAKEKDFNYKNVLIAYLKVNNALQSEADKDALTIDYMKLYKSGEWNKYKNDEFELEERKSIAFSELAEKINSLNLKEAFSIDTKFEFSDYDFSAQKFTFSPLSESTYFTLSLPYAWEYSFIPERITVFFDNPELINGLSMTKDKAKAFIQSRKDSYGNVDRSVVAEISWVITESPERNKGEVMGHILNVKIYNKQGGKLLQEYSEE